MTIRAVLVLVLVLVSLSGLPAITKGLEDQKNSLTNDKIVALSKAGLSDDAIVSLIKKSQHKFTQTPEALIKLKESGVSNAVIEAMVGSDESKDTDTSSSLPGVFGYYAVENGSLRKLDPKQTRTVLGLKVGGPRSNNRGSGVDGFEGEPPVFISNDSKEFIVYEHNIDPQKLVLAKLTYVETLQASQLNILKTEPHFFKNVYGVNFNDEIEINLWRPEAKIPVAVSPVEGKSGMYKLIPSSPLKNGYYSIYVKDSIRDYNVVFTAGAGESTTAYYFGVTNPDANILKVTAKGDIRGIWTGEIRENGEPPYMVRVNLDSLKTGTIDISSPKCHASLSDGNILGDGIKYTEKMLSGKCVPGQVTLSQIDGTSISYFREVIHKKVSYVDRGVLRNIIGGENWPRI